MKSNNGHLASHWKLGNSAQGRLTLSHMTQGASQWPWKRAQWDPGRLQAPWNVVKLWFRRGPFFGGGVDWSRKVGKGSNTARERGLREREGPLPGHSGNLSRHPARKSGQDNISKLRRTQTWKESPRGRPLSAPCFTSFFLLSLLLLLSFSISPSMPPSTPRCFKVFVQGAGGKEAKELGLCILPLHTVRLAGLLIAHVWFQELIKTWMQPLITGNAWNFLDASVVKMCGKCSEIFSRTLEFDKNIAVNGRTAQRKGTGISLYLQYIWQSTEISEVAALPSIILHAKAASVSCLDSNNLKLTCNWPHSAERKPDHFEHKRRGKLSYQYAASSCLCYEKISFKNSEREELTSSALNKSRYCKSITIVASLQFNKTNSGDCRV